MKIGQRLVDLAAEVERRANSKRDYLAPVAKMGMTVNGDPRLQLADNGGPLPLRALAHDQLATFTGIPQDYYRRMLAESPDLLASNVNTWLRRETNPKAGRLVRVLDDHVRSIHSPGFQREGMENEDFLRIILPIIKQRNLIIWSAQITDYHLFVKVVDESITLDVPTGKKVGDGSHVFFDTISPALEFSNSETGQGAYKMRWGKFTKVCTNLATHEELMRKVHLGRRAEVTDDVYEMLTSETKEKMAEALRLQTRDVIDSALSRTRLEAHAEKLGLAVAQKLPAAQVETIMDVSAKKFGWTQEERDGIFGELIEAGDLTRYGLHNAATRYSATVESYERASELERDGGSIIDLSPTEWERVTIAPKGSKDLAVAA